MQILVANATAWARKRSANIFVLQHKHFHKFGQKITFMACFIIYARRWTWPGCSTLLLPTIKVLSLRQFEPEHVITGFLGKDLYCRCLVLPIWAPPQIKIPPIVKLPLLAVFPTLHYHLCCSSPNGGATKCLGYFIALRRQITQISMHFISTQESRNPIPIVK